MFEEIKKFRSSKEQEESRKAIEAEKTQRKIREEQEYNELRKEKALQSLIDDVNFKEFKRKSAFENNLIIKKFNSFIIQLLDEFGSLVFGYKFSNEKVFVPGFLGFGDYYKTQKIKTKLYKVYEETDVISTEHHMKNCAFVLKKLEFTYRGGFRYNDLSNSEFRLLNNNESFIGFCIVLEKNHRTFRKDYDSFRNCQKEIKSVEKSIIYYTGRCKVGYYNETYRHYVDPNISSSGYGYNIDGDNSSEYVESTREKSLSYPEIVLVTKSEVSSALEKLWQGTNLTI